MTTTELNRAVARRTGETPDRIARTGFQLIDPGQTEADPQRDPEAFCVDWDVAEASGRICPFPPPSRRTATPSF